MRGRLKGERERILILAHQTEAMARQKTLHPAQYYLSKASKQKAPAAGNATVLLSAEERALVRKLGKQKGKRHGG